MRVLRARWIGDVVVGREGERMCWGLSSAKGDLGFWNALALYLQRSLAEEGSGQGKTETTLAARATIDLLPCRSAASESKESITVHDDGTVNIPVCAMSDPNPTIGVNRGRLLFMPSILGGRQLHYSRNAPNHRSFEYCFEVQQQGTYALTARVVTPSWKQSLLLSVNDSEEQIEIPLPFTVGMWDTTEPMNIELKDGMNSLKFTRAGDVKGATIKDFTLKFVDWCLE